MIINIYTNNLLLTNKMKKITIILTAFALMVITSCKKDSNPANMSVYLQDAPASGIEKIKVELKAIEIYSDVDGAWVTLTVNNTVYDLLTLDSIHPAFLGKMTLRGGTISQIRLVIGTQNTVLVGGIEHPLLLDPADLDKLKISVKENIKDGTSYKLTIDFKASESIHEDSGTYSLKASLKMTVKEI